MKKHTTRINGLIAIVILLTLAVSLVTLKAWSQTVNTRVDKLLSQMNLDQKIGQMTQVDITALKDKNDVAKYFLGSLLAGGNSELDDISPEGWANYNDSVQKIALTTPLKIPLLFGIDAVHGHNNVQGAVIFPHNIGLGCTNNPELVEKAHHITALEMAGTGINWDFAPCVAVVQNERWGRTYESFGESPDLVRVMADAAVRGLQGDEASGFTGIAASTKHFLADGGTIDGIDQGNCECDEETLRKIHLPGYLEAIKAGTKTIMASYSSWNGEKMHGNKYLLTDVLKNELGFQGFVVSDWAGIDQLPGDFKTQIKTSINAGLDMAMIPNGPGQNNNYIEFITNLRELVNEGAVPMSRIDDAVRRILKVKLELGVFEHPLTNKNLTAQIGSKEHREVARQCVRESLVLLKNENRVLPFSKGLKHIHVAGKSADDIGNQCGGWTISWQGDSGNIIDGGTTILEAVKNTVSPNTSVTYSPDGAGAEGADVALVVIGETPYAEMMGDRKDLSLPAEDVQVVKKLKAAGIPVVAVLVSGRPMIINDVLDDCDGFVAAWLPGTEGQGVADVLFGDYQFTGKLSHSWPKDMAQVPVNVGDADYDPLFPFGFGSSD